MVVVDKGQLSVVVMPADVEDWLEVDLTLELLEEAVDSVVVECPESDGNAISETPAITMITITMVVIIIAFDAPLLKFNILFDSSCSK